MTPRPTSTLWLRNRHLVLLDALALTACVFVAYTARFEGTSWLATEQERVFRLFVLAAIPARVVLYYLLGLYNRVWAAASVPELERVLVAAVGAAVLSFTIGVWGLPGVGLVATRMPIGVALLDALLAGLVIAVPRLASRFIQRRLERWRIRVTGQTPLPGALIIGAGAAGQMAAKELAAQPRAGMRPLGFLDDDRSKQGLVIGDLPVVGRVADMGQAAMATGAKYAVIAIPSASGSVIRDVVQMARASGLETRIVPSLHDQIARATGAMPVRSLRIEDLLQREPVQTDTAGVRSRVSGKSVMITGAGGSIGSELCRQLAVMHPAELVLVGRGENSIFEIQQELLAAFPFIRLVPVILDIRDRDGMARVMDRHRPVAVFHAAAHKHVPLMEANVLEALRNNVLGTKSVVDAAAAAGVPHVVLISTDKAVRPTSVMGATKRIAEQVVQLAAAATGRAYVSVRFGNVLGSRGSVVPTFLRQIRAGGPVLVTHPEMRRFFMTIPEAVQLVLQAFVLGTGGEVFCLDMGEAVPIVNLARDLIALTVTDPEAQVEIRFTGARPGEKLYEEMFFGSEDASPTSHPKVLKARNAEVSDETPLVLRRLVETLQQEAAEPVLRGYIESLVEDFQVEMAPGAEVGVKAVA
ncbi:MAG: nucleoside-diphosphate sugar epimerase/dehydratase [Gemmatimonadaceae bacterium]